MQQRGMNMKNKKSAIAILLAATLCFTSVVPVLAAETSVENPAVTESGEEIDNESFTEGEEKDNSDSGDPENSENEQSLENSGDNTPNNSNGVSDAANETSTEELSENEAVEENTDGISEEIGETAAEANTAEETAAVEEPSEIGISDEAKAAATFAGGSGTEEDPYQVSTAAQLNAVRNYPEAYFIQTTDINMSSISNWEPIGKDSDHCFWGGYDGKGHTISNLRIKNDGSESYIGLFGYAGPEIKNLNLENANIVIDLGLCDGSIDVGTLAGNAPVVNCSTSGTITVTGSDMYGCDLGGIAGKAQGIENSHSDVTITVNCNGSEDMNIGGLAGECIHGSAVNSYFKGVITTSGSCVYVGGIVGIIDWSKGIRNCVNYGDISVDNENAGSTVAGIVGTVYADDNTESVENCVNFGNITGSDEAFVVGITRADGITVHNCYNLGNIEGNSLSGRIYTSDARNVNAYSNYGYGNATVNGRIPTGGLLPSDFNGMNMSAEDIRTEISNILNECGCEWVDPSGENHGLIIASGRCGDNLTWILDESGTLTISGTGEMYDYYDLSVGENRKSGAPWDSYASDIISLNIEAGVTYIGKYALYGCLNLKDVTLPRTIVSIGNYAFAFCDQLKSIRIPSSVNNIEGYAFFNCTAISEIEFPASVNKLGMYALGNCTNITEIRFKGNAPIIENNAFLAVAATAYYPSDDTTWTESVKNNYGGDIIWKEDGIWYIITDYDTPEDTWSFYNYAVNRIPLLQNEYVKLTSGMGNAERKYVDGLISSGYSGQCYGFCVSSILEGRDILPLREINSNADQLYSVTNDQKAKSIIGYYFLHQFTDEQDANLQKFKALAPAQQINEIHNSSVPFILEFGRSGGGAHAIVGFKKESGQWTVNGKRYNYRILTYDCNHPIGDASSENSYFYYNKGTGEWIIPNYSSANYLKRITSDTEVLRRVNANSFLSKGITLRVRNFSSTNQFIIETASGQYPISGEMMEDGINVYYDTAEAGNTGEYPINISLDENKDFKVVSTNNAALDISMLNTNYCYCVESESYNSVAFDVSGGILAEGIKGNYTLEITSNEDSSVNPFYAFSIEGNNAGDISANIQDDGLHIRGYNLEGVTITGESDASAEALNITTDSEEVLITGDETGLHSLIDENKDGTFEKEITNAGSGFNHGGTETWDSDEYGFYKRELIWRLNKNGVLSIYYEGLSSDETYTLGNADNHSWKEYKNSVLEVQIGKNISNLGTSSLEGYSKLRRILFKYDPPAFMTNDTAVSPFKGKTLEIYYPADNPAWNGVIGNNYEGIITWKPCYFGSCGNELTWVLDNKGTLVISGSGIMYNWMDETRIPWKNHVKDIKTIIIKDGAENISTAAFKGCTSLSDVKLGNTVTEIGDYAFHGCVNLRTISIPNTVTSIGDETFANCSNNLIIRGKAKSYAEKYAKEKGLTFIDPFYLDYATVIGLSAKTYSGKAITQTPTVKIGSTILVPDNDYIVSYKNNINAGTASVIITGIGRYTGSVTKKFTIKKSANTITAKKITRTYSTKSQVFSLGVKIKKGTPTYKSNSKSVTVSKAGKVTVKAKFIGKAAITITAPASTNYTATTKKITVTVNPTKTALSSVSSPSAGKMTVKWKKNAVGTGYQIQYSTSSKFTSPKTVTVTKNTTLSKTIGSLAKGKKYYVRIRTYKTVGSMKFYSGWSAAKAVTIRR